MSNGVYGQAAMLAYQIRQIAFITDAPQMIPFLNPQGEGSETEMF